MKKLISILLVITLLATIFMLPSCASEEVSQLIKEIEELPSELDPINIDVLNTDPLSSGYSLSATYKDKKATYYFNDGKTSVWSTGLGIFPQEVIHYLAARYKYKSLSESDKKKVKNYDKIANHKDALDDYEYIINIGHALEKIVREVDNYCVENIKSTLKNQSSYEEYSNEVSLHQLSSRHITIIDENNIIFTNAHCTISYSATNSYGGRIDDEKSFYVSGTYSNGEVTITGTGLK